MQQTSAESLLYEYPVVRPHVVGVQFCRLFPVDAHTVVLWHFAMCTSVNCLTFILGMMLNCIRTK